MQLSHPSTNNLSHRSIILIIFILLISIPSCIFTNAMIVDERSIHIGKSNRFSSIFTFYFDQNAFLDLRANLQLTNTKPITLMFCSTSEIERIEASQMTYEKVCNSLPMGICTEEVKIEPLDPVPPPPGPTPEPETSSSIDLFTNGEIKQNHLFETLEVNTNDNDVDNNNNNIDDNDVDNNTNSDRNTNVNIRQRPQLKLVDKKKIKEMIYQSPKTNLRYRITHRSNENDNDDDNQDENNNDTGEILTNNNDNDEDNTTYGPNIGTHPLVHNIANKLTQARSKITKKANRLFDEAISIIENAQQKNSLPSDTDAANNDDMTMVPSSYQFDNNQNFDDETKEDEILYPHLVDNNHDNNLPLASLSWYDAHSYIISTLSTSIESWSDTDQSYQMSDAFPSKATTTQNTFKTLSNDQNNNHNHNNNNNNISNITSQGTAIITENADFRLFYNYTMPKKSIYYILQLNCDTIDYEITLSYTAMNPGGEHLGINEIPFKQIYTYFMYIYITTVILITLHFTYGYFRYGFPMKYSIYLPIISILLTSVCYCYTSNYYWHDASFTGKKSLTIDFISQGFNILSFFLYTIFFISLSIGYGIIRSTIPWPTCKRMIFISLFMSISKFLYHFGVGLGVLLHMLNLLFIWMIYIDGLRLSIITLQLEIDMLQTLNLKMQNVLWAGKSVLSRLCKNPFSSSNSSNTSGDTVANSTGTGNNDDNIITSTSTSTTTDNADATDQDDDNNRGDGKNMPIIDKLDMLLQLQHAAYFYVLSTILLMLWNNAMGQITSFVVEIGSLLLLLVTIIRFTYTLRLRFDDNEALHVLSLLYTRGTLSADITEKVITAVKGENEYLYSDNTTNMYLLTQNNNSNGYCSNSRPTHSNRYDSLTSHQSRAELLRFHSNVGHSSNNITNNLNNNNNNNKRNKKNNFYPPRTSTSIVHPHTLRFDSFEYNLLIAMLRGVNMNKNSISILFAPCQCFQRPKEGHLKNRFPPFLNFSGKYGICPHTYLGMRWLTGLSNSNHNNNHNNNNNNNNNHDKGYFENYYSNNNNANPAHNTSASSKRFDYLPGQALLPNAYSSQQTKTTSPTTTTTTATTTNNPVMLANSDGYIDITNNVEDFQAQNVMNSVSFDNVDVSSLVNNQSDLNLKNNNNNTANSPSQTQFTSLNQHDVLTGYVSITNTTTKRSKKNSNEEKKNFNNPILASVQDTTTTRMNVFSGFYAVDLFNDVKYGNNHSNDQPDATNNIDNSRYSINNTNRTQSPRTLQSNISPQHTGTLKNTSNGLYHPFENEE